MIDYFESRPVTALERAKAIVAKLKPEHRCPACDAQRKIETVNRLLANWFRAKPAQDW
jgi:ribosomal protein L37AE/L43A